MTSPSVENGSKKKCISTLSRCISSGPASSKIGIAVGLSRAGYPGAFAAWTGRMLPSTTALVLFAYRAAALGHALSGGWLHGLKEPSLWSPRPCSS
jgi:chromate transport protein ChrA